MTVRRKSNPVPSKDGAGDTERGGRMTKRPKVELVPVEADSDTCLAPNFSATNFGFL